MIARLTAFAAISLFAMPWTDAQNSTRTPQQKSIRESIPDTNDHEPTLSNKPTAPPDPARPATAPDPGKTNPVTAQDPPAKPSAPTTEPEPPSTEPGGESLKPAVDSPLAAPDEEPAPNPRQGLAVRVENLQHGKDRIDPSQVKLLAPFPAKPLSPAPHGWCLTSSKTAPPITREVELSPGNKITLTIRPHLLVPEADGSAVFAVPEPGYDATCGYRQNTTVSAILAHSIKQLDDDAKALGATIDKLQQLLISLPKPEPPAEPKPDPKPALKSPPTRKR